MSEDRKLTGLPQADALGQDTVLYGVQSPTTAPSSRKLSVADLGGAIRVNGSNWAGAALSVSNGGTGASSATGARSSLGVQAASGELSGIAGLAPTNDDLLQRKGDVWTNRSLAQVKTDLALNAVENKSSATIRGELTAANVTTALAYAPTSVTGLTGAQTAAGLKAGLGLTSGDVGLANVDNTPDVGKPVSTAQQTAFNGKQGLSSVLTFLATASAGTAAGVKTLLALVKGDVGLGNVDNTSDANKPVSTAQAAANALKLNLTGGTLSGALAGTSISLSSNLTATGNNGFGTVSPTAPGHFANSSGTVGQVRVQQLGAGGKTWELQSYTDGGLYFNNEANLAAIRLKDNLDANHFGNVTLPSTKSLYLDGGGDTYITESTANTISLVAGGVGRISLTQTGGVGIYASTAGMQVGIGGNLTGNAGTFISMWGGSAAGMAANISTDYFGTTDPALQLSTYGNRANPNLVLNNDGSTSVAKLLNLSGASAGQIKFPAAQNPSADPNTLDDYEEGTWTPGISFGGGATGISYSGLTGGKYTKTGRLVTVSGSIVLTSKGASTGVALITGLPFASGNTQADNGSTGCCGYLAGATGVTPFLCVSTVNIRNATTIDLTQGQTSSQLTDANFTSAFSIFFSLTYQTNG